MSDTEANRRCRWLVQCLRLAVQDEAEPPQTWDETVELAVQFGQTSVPPVTVGEYIRPGDTSLRTLIKALVSEWETESDEMRAQSVKEGLHPALARHQKEANQLRERAAELRAMLGMTDGE